VISVCSSEESGAKKTQMLRSRQNADMTDQKVRKHTFSGINNSLPYWCATCGSDTPYVPVVGTRKVTIVLSFEKYGGSAVVSITRAVPELYWFSNKSVSTSKWKIYEQNAWQTYVDYSYLPRAETATVRLSASSRVGSVDQSERSARSDNE
jgi:hypothetical protein